MPKPPRDLAALVERKDAKERSAVKETTAASRPAAPPLKLKSFRVPPEAAKQFAILAAELERSEQSLILDAMNLLFEQHGKPPVR